MILIVFRYKIVHTTCLTRHEASIAERYCHFITSLQLPIAVVQLPTVFDPKKVFTEVT